MTVGSLDIVTIQNCVKGADPVGEPVVGNRGQQGVRSSASLRMGPKRMARRCGLVTHWRCGGPRGPQRDAFVHRHRHPHPAVVTVTGPHQGSSCHVDTGMPAPEETKRRLLKWQLQVRCPGRSVRPGRGRERVMGQSQTQSRQTGPNGQPEGPTIGGQAGRTPAAPTYRDSPDLLRVWASVKPNGTTATLLS